MTNCGRFFKHAPVPARIAWSMKKNAYVYCLFTLLGTVIGAGMASGSEIGIYFAPFGALAPLAIALCSLLFGLLYYTFARYMQKEGISDVYALCKRLLGRAGGAVYFVLAAGSLVIAGAMLSALREWGSALSVKGEILVLPIAAVAAVSAMYAGRIGQICKIAVPFIVLVIFLQFALLPKGMPAGGYTPRLWANPFTYAMYNISLSLGLMAAAAPRCTRKGHAWVGGMLGGIMAALLMLLLLLVADSRAELPVLAASFGFARVITLLSLFAALFTTLISALYNIRSAARSKGVMWLAALGAYGASFLPLSAFIRYAYPATGVAGLCLLSAILYNTFKRAGKNSPP